MDIKEIDRAIDGIVYRDGCHPAKEYTDGLKAIMRAVPRLPDDIETTDEVGQLDAYWNRDDGFTLLVDFQEDSNIEMELIDAGRMNPDMDREEFATEWARVARTSRFLDIHHAMDASIYAGVIAAFDAGTDSIAYDDSHEDLGAAPTAFTVGPDSELGRTISDAFGANPTD